MTQLLASVRTATEASMALQAGADIIDLKDPGKGALGALTSHTIKEISELVAGAVPVSATIGDLPVDAQALVSTIEHTAAHGVDIIKVGFFGDNGHDDWITALQPAIAEGNDIVAVLFVEHGLHLEVLPRLKEAGFHGVMLDTAIKNGKNLLDYMSLETLRVFLSIAHKNGLSTGLAGSLRLSHIPILAPLDPTYLGFRSALCKDLDRQGHMVASHVEEAKRLLHERDTKYGNASRA